MDTLLFTAIPRGIEKCQKEMNKRTTSERVNKRIFNGSTIQLHLIEIFSH
ncbi:hypothetical protein [Clostridium estertheticum]|nr:hypothetical protein [Clostridium estertheticum]MBU3183736.1 hypothetical protein [Clostridium estertheticum]